MGEVGGFPAAKDGRKTPNKTASMNAYKQIISNGFLVILGMAYLIYNTQYPLGTLSKPGPGVFPLILGSMVVLLASAQIIQALRQRQKTKANRTINTAQEVAEVALDERRPWLMALIIAAYITCLNFVGFYISTFLLVIAGSKLMGARDWTRLIALAAGILIACYFIFAMWLRLPLPRGFLF